MSLYRDPIGGLVQYVNDIKPYHTKLIDVIVTYVYEEPVNTTVLEAHQINVTFNMDYSREPCFFGYDTDSYDTTYNIPDFGYAINHANAYHVDCMLSGCENHYNTVLTTLLNIHDIVTLPFEYIYGVDTLYTYINGSLKSNVFQQIKPIVIDDGSLDMGDRTNTNKIVCLQILPVGTKILISTHKVGVDNECWPDLASYGFESHTFDEHNFDLADPSFHRWRFGFDQPAIDTTRFDTPDPYGWNDDCKCPPYHPYASPTSVLPTILEDLLFVEMMTFNEAINVSVYDWSDNWAEGFDLSPFSDINFDATSLWDVIDNHGYNFIQNFGDQGQPTLIKTNFIISDAQFGSIGIHVIEHTSITEGFQDTRDNLGYDMIPVDLMGFDENDEADIFASTTITEIFNITEVIEFKDIIGVTIVDPAHGTSDWYTTTPPMPI